MTNTYSDGFLRVTWRSSIGAMLRRRALFAYAAALAAGAAAPAPAQQRAAPRRAPDMQRVFDRGRLVVAVAGFAAPPFVTIAADGALGGHDIALAQGMAQAIGLPLAFDRDATSFDDVIDKVAQGAADLGISRLSATPARATLVRFSRPYLVLHHALLVSRPASRSLRSKPATRRSRSSPAPRRPSMRAASWRPRACARIGAGIRMWSTPCVAARSSPAAATRSRQSARWRRGPTRRDSAAPLSVEQLLGQPDKPAE